MNKSSDDVQDLKDHFNVEFVRLFERIQRGVHQNAVAHGFLAEPINDAAEIAGMMAELGEALQALRNGNPESANIYGFSSATEELADLIMRAMSYAEERGFEVAGAIVAKHEFNKTRPYKHGKEF